VARVAQAMLGGYMSGEEDRKAAAGQQSIVDFLPIRLTQTPTINSIHS